MCFQSYRIQLYGWRHHDDFIIHLRMHNLPMLHIPYEILTAGYCCFSQTIMFAFHTRASSTFSSHVLCLLMPIKDVCDTYTWRCIWRAAHAPIDITISAVANQVSSLPPSVCTHTNTLLHTTPHRTTKRRPCWKMYYENARTMRIVEK